MSFFQELKRRNVFRVGIAYVLMGWVLLQGADFTMDLIDAPNWVIQAMAVAVVLGLPVALVFAWAFELTPEGVKRESEVDRSQSVAPNTGRKLNRVIIAVLVLVVLLMGVERVFFAADTPPEAPEEAVTIETDVAEKSIAVLPFRDMSAAGDQAYFGEGIAEEVLNALVKLDGLKVASRTSSFSLVKQDLDIPAIAARLDVNHILEGSIRTSGEQVRVTAQLIDVKEDAHLWSETFNGTLEDIFKIQDEITVQIISALQVQLGGQPVVTATERLTDDPEAYRLYLMGRHLWRQRSRESLNQAENLLKQALERDPDFHQAWSSLALVYSVIPQYDLSLNGMEMYEKGLAAAKQALSLDPGSGEARLGIISYLETSCRMPEAVTQYEEVIKSNPEDPTAHHWLGLLLNDVGHTARAKEELATAYRLDPLILDIMVVQSEIEVVLGHYDRSRELFQKAASMGYQDGDRFEEGFAALQQGDIESARALMLLGRIVKDDRQVERLRLFFAALDDPDKLPEFHQIIGTSGDYTSFRELDIVRLLATSNDPYLFEFLATNNCPWASHDMWAEGFREQRGKPEFLDLMKRIGAVEMWEQYGWPDDCQSVYGCPEP